MSWGNVKEESTLDIAARLGREYRLKLTTPNIKEMKMSDEIDTIKKMLNDAAIQLKREHGITPYCVNKIWHYCNDLPRPTQEPLQVIEGLSDALTRAEMWQPSENATQTRADYDAFVKAAKAYQQALEKQEK